MAGYDYVQEVVPGSFVVLEKLTKDGGSLEYDSGEYIATRVTPFAVYGVKPKAGYGGHEEKSFVISGTSPWRVSAVEFDKPAAVAFAKELIAWGSQSQTGYIESVGASAVRIGKQLLGVLGVSDAPSVAAVAPTPYTLSPALEKITDKFECHFARVKEFARQLLAEIKGVN